LFFGSGLDVSGFSPTTDRCFTRGGSGNRLRYGGCGSTTARRRRRCGFLLGANALLALPSCADARHLVVREHAHVAAKWNVHLTK